MDAATARLDAAPDADAQPEPVDATRADAAEVGERAEGSADAAAEPSSLTLQTSAGRLLGKREGRSRLFLGIPYARPPLAALRFAPPEPAPPWTGTRTALELGPSCPQPAEGVNGAVAEDCLTLNVTTPLHPSPGGAAVMVFLHGGGFGTGSGSGYPAQWLSEPSGSVIVTLNYRLGPLGFLTHPDLDAALGLPSGNMGLRDQQLALRWVHDNIAAFGGDPGRVTLFGESAGALSACFHMFARGSEQLAHRFIMESGSCVMGSLRAKSRAKARADGTAFANQHCALATDVVACLRALPVAAFVASEFVAAASGWGGAGWPHTDGVLLPDSPSAELKAGNFSHGPLIVGSNQREAALYPLHGFTLPKTRFDMLALLLGLYPEDWAQIYAHYEPPDDSGASEAFIRAQTDELFRCPSRALARAASEQGRPTYLYSFAVPPAAHSQELDYVFGWPSGGVSERFPGEAPNPPIAAVVQGTQRYWTTFAASGDPNDGSQLKWPAYRTSSDPNLVIGQPFRVETQLSQSDCDFWDTLYAGRP